MKTIHEKLICQKNSCLIAFNALFTLSSLEDKIFDKLQIYLTFQRKEFGFHSFIKLGAF